MDMEYIDLRSDTVTMPTDEMLDAMRGAKAGDDVYGDDSTVNLLEEKSARILGMEDAVFVPSGTFGNQLCVLTHTRRGEEVLIPADNHIVLYEVGASAVISGVQLRFVKSLNGTIDYEDLKNLYRTEDIHHPRTGLICMENAHTNGKVVPLVNMEEVYKFAKNHEIGTHLDGARIFNAAASLKVKPADIAKYADSVMFCFSKGLCAPIGSIVAGSNKFIKEARKNRKMMGGGMRQAGYIAAPCIVALDKMIKRLYVDHENAIYLANRLKDIELFEVLEDRLDINMVFFKVKNVKKAGIHFDDSSFVYYLFKNKIKINPLHNDEYRFVTHYYTTKEKIDILIENIKEYLEQKSLDKITFNKN